MPTKSDSDIIFCLQLLSKTLTCTLYLSLRESIDHLCNNPILRIGVKHKCSIDSKSLVTLQTNMMSLSFLAGRTVINLIRSEHECYSFNYMALKVRKKAKIRYPYNQISHLYRHLLHDHRLKSFFLTKAVKILT